MICAALIAEVSISPILVQDGKTIGNARKNDFELLMGPRAPKDAGHVSNHQIKEPLIVRIKSLARIDPENEGQLGPVLPWYRRGQNDRLRNGLGPILQATFTTSVLA